MQVPPGTYTVTGTSLRFDDGDSPCQASGTVTVARDRARIADVYCQM